ncbi:MAG TPA: T9SS type A sorting domain-containing protein, partial [Bacteroidia bacterium]
ATSASWSGGTGTFSPNATTLNAVYTPSAGDITAGTVTLTLTTDDPQGPCGSGSDQMVITINPGATVNANVDQTICAGSTVTLAGSIGGSATSASWTSSGTGVFSPNAITLSATYTPSATDTAAGSVTLTLTTNDPSGPCPFVTDQMVITINPAAIANANNDQAICAGSDATLAGSIGGGATSATWTSSGTGTFLPDNITLNAVYVPSQGDITLGSVVLTLTTSGNCPASDSVTITINPLPLVELGADTTVTFCAGFLALDAGTSATTYSWSTGATTQVIHVSASGTYYVDVANSYGCTASDTINVTVNTGTLTVDLGRDTVMVTCVNDPVLLDAGVSGALYTWSTGETTQTISVDSTGIYYVTVTDSIGCSASDTISVSYSNGTFAVNLGQDTTICGCILLSAYTPGGTSYSWSTGGTYPTINVCTSGVYWVVVSNGTCIESDTISITVNTPPLVNLGNDTTVVTFVVLNAGNPGDQFSWSTGATTQSVTVTNTGTYYVTVTDSFGCTSSDTIQIIVSTGINDLTGTQYLHVYPNPSKGTMQLEYEVPAGISAKFLIYDAAGKTVFTAELAGGHHQLTLDLSYLEDGLYLYEISSNSRQTVRSKLVIIK